MTPPLEQVRIISAAVEDAREAHRLAFELGDIPMDGHTALTEEPLDGRDVDCMKCGHINEAEYLMAELEGSR